MRGTRQPDPTTGWTVTRNSTASIIYEKELADNVFSHHAMLYYAGAADRMEMVCKTRGLPLTRSGFIVMMAGNLLNKVMEWMNGFVRLSENAESLLQEKDMLQYLAVMLCSHTTGLTMAKSIDLLKRFGAVVPSLQRVRWVSQHLLAFPIVGRGKDGASNWMAQRDQTPNLTEFEQTAFKDTKDIFLHVVHLFLTLDDDLFGTRAADNQVKLLSSRKADKEGHSADAVADALSRIVFGLRFRRRGETQVDAVKALLSGIFEGKGEDSLNGCMVTADRGYGKESFLNLMASFGVASAFIMPDHILRAHPFVASSFMNPHRDDDNDMADGSDSGGDSERRGEGSASTASHVMAMHDRRRAFVINDEAQLGPAVFAASKALKTTGVGQRRVTAVAVREHGTSKFSKVLRFMYALPSSVSAELDKWVAVPKPGVSTAQTLYSESTDVLGKKCEAVLSHSCFPLTIGQRCADWFTLRQFRVTGTNAGIILRQNEAFLAAMNLTAGTTEERTLSQWFTLFCNGWFNSKVSTEAMMRGTANEGPVIQFVRNLSFVASVYDVGMLALTRHPHLACSPDGVALIKADASVSDFLEGEGDIQCSGMTLWMAPVEIKTKVAATSLGDTLTLTRAEPVFCCISDGVCRRFVPRDHLVQVVQQATVLRSTFAMYVVASETGVMYTVVAKVPAHLREICRNSLNAVAEGIVRWAHEPDGSIPSFVAVQEREVVRTRWEFWKVVNDHVKSKGPFRPLKVFKHAMQSFYSKTKGGVDGATQQRAILRSSTSHLAWEQKLVSQVLKTVSLNAFFAWRIFERRDLLLTMEDFKNLECFRNAVNKVQSTADFMLDAALEILAHASALCPERSGEHETAVMNPQERRALVTLAAGRKRRRLEFFNSDRGVTLRLNVPGHTPRQGKYQYCALCGQHRDLKGSNGKVWRGHRTTYSCQLCSVNLCVRVYSGLRKSCWSVWHSTKELSLRHTPCPSRDAPEEHNESDEEDDAVGASESDVPPNTSEDHEANASNEAPQSASNIRRTPRRSARVQS